MAYPHPHSYMAAVGAGFVASGTIVVPVLMPKKPGCMCCTLEQRHFLAS